MDTMQIIKARSSTRAYTSQPLTEAEIEAVVNAGLQAPTATNRQEIRFTVLKAGDPILKEIEDEKNRLRRISDPEQNFYYNAPTVIMLAAENKFRWRSVDAGIAVENMALAAEALGLGSVIIGCIYDAMRGKKQEYFNQALKFPDGYLFEIALAVGHKLAEKEPHSYDAAAQVVYL